MKTKMISLSFAVLFSTLSLVWVAEEAFARGRRSYYEFRAARYVARYQNNQKCARGEISLSDPRCQEYNQEIAYIQRVFPRETAARIYQARQYAALLLRQDQVRRQQYTLPSSPAIATPVSRPAISSPASTPAISVQQGVDDFDKCRAGELPISDPRCEIYRKRIGM